MGEKKRFLELSITLPEVKAGTSRLSTLLFISFSIAVMFLRIYYCLIIPFYSQDMLRNMWYGLFVTEKGLSAAGIPLAILDPTLSSISFSHFPCQYPIVAILFFSVTSLIWPSPFFIKLCLTIIEAVNSLLIYRLTGDRVATLFYWASPLSIIWVSQEGQFEPLQNLFILIAFLLLPSKTFSAFISLALAIQVKISAILLLPYFLVHAAKNKKLSLSIGAGFIAGFIPTLISQAFYPCIQQVCMYSALLLYNPYYWNFKATGIFTFNHMVYMPFNQISSYVLLSILVYGAIRGKNPFPYLAPFLFMLACKFHHNVMFWYMIILPSFYIAIGDQKMRRILFIVTIFLDFASLVEIFRILGGNTLFTPFIDLSPLDRLRVKFP